MSAVIAEAVAGRMEAEHRAKVLYQSLKLSIAMLKKAGADVTKFNEILKEYKP